MTIQEITDKLQSQGNSITYRVRSDGGVLITSINGRKFVGAEGNRIARMMIGETLSEKRTAQLEKIRPKKKNQLSMGLKRKIARVQRKWKKNVNPTKGKITTEKVRWNVEHLGIDTAIRKLNEAEKYAMGIAYRANLDRFIEHINHYITVNTTLSEDQKDKLQDLISWIDSHEYQIKEKGIEPAYKQFYDNVENALDEIQFEYGINGVKLCLLGK